MMSPVNLRAFQRKLRLTARVRQTILRAKRRRLRLKAN
jgi:hypothetical protein